MCLRGLLYSKYSAELFLSVEPNSRAQYVLIGFGIMHFHFPQDDRIAGWKIVFLQYLVAGAFCLLLIGYWRLQIGQHNLYLDQAERNRTRNLPVIAPRGRILDREGRVLADNFPAFSILMMRENAESVTPGAVEGIARGLQLNPEDLTRQVEAAARLPHFQPLLLKQSATLEDIAFVESHQIEYPQLAIIQVQQRLYPLHKTVAAVLGYVGEVPEETLDKADSPYKPGDQVGKFGIERTYDSILAGRDGMRRVVVNSRGQEVGSMNTINALPGNDLRLTLDLDLQNAAEQALGDQEGAVVAFDPRTGDVLAMVSHPSFDPNDFAKRIDKDAWQQLMDDPDKPMMNKAIQAQLAPGSIFKIFTAAAGLETGEINPNFTVYCPGQVTIYGHTYHDWTFDKGHGHGSVSMHNAIVHSCDVYFYTLGKIIGIDKIAYFAKRLGLGAKTGIDLPAESSGLIPSPEWAQAAFKRKWWAGETMSVAIGQGAVEVTPLQLAYALGGIASGGVFRRPHLAFKDDLHALHVNMPENSDRHFPLKEETLDVLLKGMWGVVNEGGGTGAGARCPGIEIAGKTGTAQVVSVDLQKSAHNRDFNNNAWFVGFSPSTEPQIVVAALVMKGGHSAVAVPIARDVIKAYYEKKNPQKPEEQLQTQVKVLSEVSGAPPIPVTAPAH
jgi:penicillin-binding protein 2